MQRNRKVKIVATLGPSSSEAATIRALFEAGADVFRLNFSHGSQDDHRRNVEIIRALEREMGRPIGILVDLQGPKLRIGRIEGGEVRMETGAGFRLDLGDRPGDNRRAPLPHPEVFAAIHPGTELLIDDGRLRLRVEDCGKDYAETTVVTGGPLSDRKGVNVPGVVLPISPLTDKDRDDLRFGLDLGVDWVGLSFVQRPHDVAEARRLIAGRAAIMVKVEKPAAVAQLSELVEQAEAIMVARGDMGVEMAPEVVPGRQKEIIRACRLAGKPVVVATQMLESMVHAPAPTRAEASDVATAVYDGADAIMLSAETASGEYPVDAVTMMDRIAIRTESDPFYRPIIHALHPEPEATAPDAISAAAAQVATTIRATAIVSYTTSGSTALRAARERPDVPILVLTSKRETARRLALTWGVHCVHTSDVSSFQEMVHKACRVALGEGVVGTGDKVVITAGVPFGTPGATNVLHIAWAER
ncbi:MAG: pyruvate kinase [Kiloniellaceae bacterium]